MSKINERKEENSKSQEQDHKGLILRVNHIPKSNGTPLRQQILINSKLIQGNKLLQFLKTNDIVTPLLHDGDNLVELYLFLFILHFDLLIPKVKLVI